MQDAGMGGGGEGTDPGWTTKYPVQAQAEAGHTPPRALL